MKKLFGLALVPVLLAAALPLSASAEKTWTQPEKTGARTEVKQTQTRAVQRHEGVTRTTTQRLSVLDERINPLWVKGQWDLVTRQYPQAIESFKDLLVIDPDNVHALNGMAIALFSQGRYDEALTRVERAIEVDPVNSRLFLTKARILDARMQPREAVEAYLTYASLSPEDGAVLEAQRRADELFRQVEPQLSEAHKSYLMGLHRLSLHQPREAIQMFEKFHALEPSNTEAHILLGRSYIELGQPMKAIPHFEAAVKADVQNPVAYYQLGSSYDLSGQSKMASDAWQKFVQYAPKSESALLINRRFENRQ